MSKDSAKKTDSPPVETYAEGLEVINGDLISVKVKHSILEHACVSVSALCKSYDPSL